MHDPAGPASRSHEEWRGPRFTGQLYIDLETAEEVDALWEKVKDRAEVIYAACMSSASVTTAATLSRSARLPRK